MNQVNIKKSKTNPSNNDNFTSILQGTNNEIAIN